jgi:shikimate dehydrogenase
MSSNIGVMGHPIGHTKSPVFQQAGLDKLGIKETFEAWDVAPEDLEEKVKTFRGDGSWRAVSLCLISRQLSRWSTS